MSVLKKLLSCFSADYKKSDQELLDALENNQDQYIMKSNGSIALNLANLQTQKKIQDEIAKYKSFTLSTKG